MALVGDYMAPYIYIYVYIYIYIYIHIHIYCIYIFEAPFSKGVPAEMANGWDNACWDITKSTAQNCKKIGTRCYSLFKSGKKIMNLLLWDTTPPICILDSPGPCGSHRWRSARLQYIQCVSNGDTAVLYSAIDICTNESGHYCFI